MFFSYPRYLYRIDPTYILILDLPHTHFCFVHVVFPFTFNLVCEGT